MIQQIFCDQNKKELKNYRIVISYDTSKKNISTLMVARHVSDGSIEIILEAQNENADMLWYFFKDFIVEIKNNNIQLIQEN